jgi:hypothetical protein
MFQRLIAQALVTCKIWAFAASITDLLWAETPDHPDGRVQWRYHVAPALLVLAPNGDTQELAFDPILFDGPVLLKEWLAALHDTPTLVRTSRGEPPVASLGGSGYWPGPDPLEGPDLHALETLEEYRHWNAWQRPI